MLKTHGNLLIICGLTILAGACSSGARMPDLEKAPGQIIVLDSPQRVSQTEELDARYAVGWWPRLAKDNSGQIHLVYCDAEKADFDYARYDGNSWKKGTIVSKGAVGKYPALAVDGQNHLHVTFYDQDAKHYNYGYFDGAAWRFERLSYGNETGPGASIAIDKSNLPHIIFYSQSGRLIYFHRLQQLTGVTGTANEPNYQQHKDAEWQMRIIGNYGGGFTTKTDLQFAENGRLYASFVNSQLVESGFYYGFYDGQSWQTANVASREAPGWSSNVLFDEKGPLLVYGSLLKERLYLTHIMADGTWNTEMLYLRSGPLVSAFDPQKRLFIAHQYLLPGSRGFGQMRLLVKDGENMHWYELDNARDSGQYLDMVLDKNGRPVIAYYDPVSRSLKVYMENK